MLYKTSFFPGFLLAVLLLILPAAHLVAQFPMPPNVPIWDANKVILTLQKLSDNIYAVIPSTANAETTKGIPQATTGGIIVGVKGVLVIETMLSKKLYDQMYKLVRSITQKPIIYAINTSDHGDHCFGNYLLPKETIIIQNEFCKESLAKSFEQIKQFMIMLFGKGRGMESVKFRAADMAIPKNETLQVDMGNGIHVAIKNLGLAQSPADLFVYVKNKEKNILWAGNPFIAEQPAIPWLFDGYFLEPVNNLNKIYNDLGEDDVVVPGHGRITNKAGIKYTVDYVNALKSNITEAVSRGLTLEETQQSVAMKEFDHGYTLFHWLHFNFNVSNAYKDIKATSAKTASIGSN